MSEGEGRAAVTLSISGGAQQSTTRGGYSWT